MPASSNAASSCWHTDWSLVSASEVQPDCSPLGRVRQHVCRDAHWPVGVPPLLLPLPLPLPPLLEVVWHSLEQFWVSQSSMAWPAVGQLPSWALAEHDCAALSLKVPPGHSQLIKSLQALSAVLSCDEHLLSTHEVQAWLFVLEARHEFPVELLLLEHAKTASAAAAMAPLIQITLFIDVFLPEWTPPRLDGTAHETTQRKCGPTLAGGPPSA
jgi:hypothetical protein